MSEISRRDFLKKSLLYSGTIAGLAPLLSQCSAKNDKKINILFAISDDQSWPHSSAYGCKFVKTPAFDRIAKEGILFNNAFCPAPQCSPCRASTLTGKNIWQIEEAGTHASSFPKKHKVFTDILNESGYETGYTGKPWGPGNWEISGRTQNPAGPEFNKIKYESVSNKLSSINYAENFKSFVEQKEKNKPFFFWFGCFEPHRVYEPGSGIKQGKTIEDVTVPPFLPNVDEIKSDMLDYALEIEWFDKHLDSMINYLSDIGELNNTLIVVTSDNGMPFPRAKANLYEYGIHMPLAIRCPKIIKNPGRKVDDLVSFVDFTPTFMELSNNNIPEKLPGKSLLNILSSEKEGIVDSTRTSVIVGRERHTHARPDNLGYPSRAIRTEEYLYIMNLKPDRWPAGDPSGSGDPEEYHDIDSSPTKNYLVGNKDKKEIEPYFELATAKRDEEELYNIKNDPGCLENLISNSQFQNIKEKLKSELIKKLKEQGDPRMFNMGDVFESYPRYYRMRNFEGFKDSGAYNEKYIL